MRSGTTSKLWDLVQMARMKPLTRVLLKLAGIHRTHHLITDCTNMYHLSLKFAMTYLYSPRSQLLWETPSSRLSLTVSFQSSFSAESALTLSRCAALVWAARFALASTNCSLSAYMHSWIDSFQMSSTTTKLWLPESAAMRQLWLIPPVN